MEFKNEVDVKTLSIFKELRDFLETSLARLKPWLDDPIYNDENMTMRTIINNLKLTTERVSDSSRSLSLEEWIENFKERHRSMGIVVTYNELGEKKSISTVVQRELTCILQEACGNAIKHGKAGMIQILVIYQDHELKITIADNGVGMDLSKLDNKDSGGAGVSNMLSRINKIGGNLQFFNKEGESGTVVVIDLSEQGLDEIEETTIETQVGRALHDLLCPEIIGVIMILVNIKNDLKEIEAKKWCEIKNTEEKLGQFAVDLRSLSHQLI